MENTKDLLRLLTQKICNELEVIELPKSNIWTVVSPPDEPPHVAMDIDRPALSNLLPSLSMWLLRSPEYDAVAKAIECDHKLGEGIVIDAGGVLRKPERTNITRAVITNFLWRYLREGEMLNWDELRFEETFKELRAELHRKSVVFHTIMPLSNLKMEMDSLNFGKELKLLPASTEELERWLNPDYSLPTLGMGPPRWSIHQIDKPAVLHMYKTIKGRLPTTDSPGALEQWPQVSIDSVITALRLVFDTPISIIFQEHRSTGMMALGGHGTSWSLSSPKLAPIVTLNEEKAKQVIHVWQLLQKSPNLDLIKLPIRRWESSLLRQSLEDRLIDAWISLEAFLLLGKEGELSYRAAVLLAEFLGTGGPDRKAIFDSTRFSYKWRSAIVHGLSTKKLAKRSSLQETVRITTEYLRLALLKVLVLPTRLNLDKLETDLLSRESKSS